MDFVALFVHVLLLCLVFGLFYWMAGLAATIAPAPMQSKVRAVLLIVVGLMAVLFLLGEIGMWGSWGVGHHARL